MIRAEPNTYKYPIQQIQNIDNKPLFLFLAELFFFFFGLIPKIQKIALEALKIGFLVEMPILKKPAEFEGGEPSTVLSFLSNSNFRV
jgi:hypothetical protein